MMKRSAATEVLSRAGFILAPWRNSGGWTLTRPEHMQVVGVAGERLEVYSDACRIYPHSGKWRFERWLSAPGPGPDDIVFEAEELDDAVRVAIRYYLGEELEIDGWRIPAHRHPEWNLESLTAVVKGANEVSSSEWYEVQKEYHRRYTEALDGKRPGWPGHPELTFLRIAHPSQNDLVLWLRRDLGACYVVRQLQPSS